jgi:hypothetical protein
MPFMTQDLTSLRLQCPCCLGVGPWLRVVVVGVAEQCVSGAIDPNADSPFGDAYVISLGFIVVLCVTIPIGFFNLEENM